MNTTNTCHEFFNLKLIIPKNQYLLTQIVNTLKLNLEYYELLIIKLNCAHLVPLYLVPL